MKLLKWIRSLLHIYQGLYQDGPDISWKLGVNHFSSLREISVNVDYCAIFSGFKATLKYRSFTKDSFNEIVHLNKCYNSDFLIKKGNVQIDYRNISVFEMVFFQICEKELFLMYEPIEAAMCIKLT